ncbi:MAG: hypothetical protein L0Y80_12010 [Ignavibacteriae bacterium]|nr:hypothetical protein [Ignavibacteriota bacterium]
MTHAQIDYQKVRGDIENKITELQKALEKHDSKIAKDPKNYCYVGDMNRVQELLIEAEQFIR